MTAANIHCRHLRWKPKPSSWGAQITQDFEKWVAKHGNIHATLAWPRYVACHSSVLLMMGDTISRNTKNEMWMQKDNAVEGCFTWACHSRTARSCRSPHKTLTSQCPLPHLNKRSANWGRFRVGGLAADLCPYKPAHLFHLQCWDFDVVCCVLHTEP